MGLLKITNDTIRPLVDQLTTKYPILKTFTLLHNIFTLCQDSRDELSMLAESVYNNIGTGMTNPVDILLTDNADEFVAMNVEKFTAYLDHELDDFKMIVWAAQFYGKSIEELAEDAIGVCDYEHQVFQCIKDDNLLKIFLHMIKCDILISLGILFYRLHISMMLHCDHFPMTEEICHVIIRQIHKEKSYDYDNLINTYIEDHNYNVCKLHKIVTSLLVKIKVDNPEIYHEDYYRVVFKKIYDMYYDAITQYLSIRKNPEELKKYINENLDMSGLGSGSWPSEYTRAHKYKDYLFAVPYLIISEHNKKNIEQQLEKNIVDLSGVSLDIEL